MPIDHSKLKAEVEAAILAEFARVGPEEFDKSVIWRKFADRKASRPTIYRWMGEMIASGRAGQHLAGKLRQATTERQAAPDPAAAAGRAAGAHLPLVVRPQDVAGGQSSIEFIGLLVACITSAQQVMAYSRTEDGKVRVPKMLLAASEHLRRSLETAARIQDSVNQASNLEEFQEAVIETVRKVAERHPEVAEEMVAELGRLAQRWM